MIKMNANSAFLTQFLSISGNFSFDTNYKRVLKTFRGDRVIEIDLHRVYERGIYT